MPTTPPTIKIRNDAGESATFLIAAASVFRRPLFYEAERGKWAVAGMVPFSLSLEVPLRRLSAHQTAFQKLEIWGGKREMEMRVEGAVHAWWHRQRLLSGLAWDLIAAAALLRPEGPPKSVLMLGLAGGTSLRILRRLLPEAELTALEIDEQIVGIARETMHLDELGLEIKIADAYGWLAKNRRRFDVVIDDIYTAGADDVFRSRTWDAELLDRLRRAVAPGGLLAVNLITGSGHRRMQSATRAIVRASFREARVLTTPACLNEVLVAGDAVAPPAALKPWRERFAHPRDRELWDLIASRKLGRLSQGKNSQRPS